MLPVEYTKLSRDCASKGSAEQAFCCSLNDAAAIFTLSIAPNYKYWLKCGTFDPDTFSKTLINYDESTESMAMSEQTTRGLFWVLFVAIIATPQCVNAQSATGRVTYVLPYTILEDSYSYEVGADGSFVLDRFRRVKINTKAGVDNQSQMSTTYSSSLEELEVIEAFTEHNGKRSIVSKDRILRRPNATNIDAPLFEDAYAITTIFPDVDVGSVLSIRSKRTQKVPLFNGVFSQVLHFSRTTHSLGAQISLRAPESLAIKFDAVDMQGGEVASDMSGVRKWHWTYAGNDPHISEIGSISTIDFSPRLAITSLPDSDAAARAYLTQARPQANVSPAIKT